jgi:hypothetical protein
MDMILLERPIHGSTNCIRKSVPHLNRADVSQLLSSFLTRTRISSPTAAAFSMMMLATTPKEDANTFAELENIFKNAGFTRVELAPPEIGLERLVVASR